MCLNSASTLVPKMRNYSRSIDGCLKYATLVLMAALPGTYLGGIASHFVAVDVGVLRCALGGAFALAAAIYFRSDLNISE